MVCGPTVKDHANSVVLLSSSQLIRNGSETRVRLKHDMLPGGSQIIFPKEVRQHHRDGRPKADRNVSRFYDQDDGSDSREN